MSLGFRGNGDFKPKFQTINIVFANGGVGDHIASLTAVDYILKRYTWIYPLIYVPDFLLEFSKNVLPSNACVRDYSSMQKKYDQNFPTKTTKWDGLTSPMKMHLTDYAFLKLCDEVVSIEHKNYLKVRTNRVDLGKIELPNKYAILAVGHTVKVREFPPNTVNEIVDYLLAKNITPVFLGQTNTKTGAVHTIKGHFSAGINYDKGLNLIDKTSLVQAAKIMEGAKVVVGVDSGLLHVAGCTDVPIVGGFTTVNPEIRMPVRHNELGWHYYSVVQDEDLKCRYCQVRTNFIYEHDYVNCIYKDFKCVKSLISEKFIAQLEKVEGL